MQNSAPRPSLDWCVFLDVDGTMLEFADSPWGSHANEDLKDILRNLAGKLDGAVAIVSGRSIGYLDALLAPLRLPAAGLHGIERRSASGEVHGANYQDSRLDGARGALEAFSAAHPGVHIEDKGRALAIHFRSAPGLEASIRREIDRAVGELGGGYHVQEGSMVLEIKPRGPTKGTAIEAFLQEAPFWGRIPVFAGDDLTDQDGFRVIEAHRGISIAVGDKVPAQWRVEDPARLREWLRSFASLDGGAA